MTTPQPGQMPQPAGPHAQAGAAAPEPPGVTTPALPVPQALVLVMVGGVIGTLLRAVIASQETLMSVAADTVPLHTLLINVIGCFALGALIGIDQRWGLASWVRPFLGTGVLGGFTTFSAYAAHTLVQNSSWALTVLIVTPLSCMIAALLGIWAVARD